MREDWVCALCQMQSRDLGIHGETRANSHNTYLLRPFAAQRTWGIDNFQSMHSDCGLSSPCATRSNHFSESITQFTASMPLRHVFLSLCLFLFPCIFQVRMCLVMLLAGFLRVWPIRLLFLPMIYVPARYWSPLLDRFLLVIFTSQ